MNKMLICLSFVVIIIMILVVRTILFPFTKNHTTATVGKMQVSELSIKRFAEGLSFATISERNYEETNFAEFEAFQLFMERAYPEVYMATEHYTIDTYSMIFRWKGKNAALKPILFLSHYDVVPPGDFSYLEHNEMQTMSFDLADEALPAATTIAETWDYPPFSGTVAKGRVSTCH